jgi:hypothetical protein
VLVGVEGGQRDHRRWVGKAVAEPFVIDLADPATYRNDWGGPSLLGFLLS